jgi:hypothetical protein
MTIARTLSPSFAVILVIALGACGGSSGSGGSDDSSGPVDATAPVATPVTTPAGPIAAFTAAAAASANAPVAFDAGGSSSSDGSALQYVWDFGNGQRGGGMTIAHLFGSGGSKTVTLTVIDAAGRSASASRTVSVAAAPAAANTVSAQGAIAALDGTALAGVSATVVGGNASAVSDATGKLNLTLGTGVPVVLKLSKAGYSDQFVALDVPATAGADTYFEAAMRTRDAAMTLTDAASGGTLTGRDGAVITLPANALVDGTGSAVTGAVQIAVTPVDVTQPGAGGFPGSFDGAQTDATMTPIVSLGVAEYVLSASERPLQLAPGKSATIEIPIYAAKRLDGSVVASGDSIPLWSLDEQTGAWVQEGVGTVVPSGGSPSGFAMRASVSHFTWWNADVPLQRNETGPQPQCVYDTDIGIPGGNDTFATATICNMLAEIDRTTGATATRTRALARPLAGSSNLPGFSRRQVIPIGGGRTMAVPANVNIRLTARALYGTWGGSVVFNGAEGVQAPVIIKMRPLSYVAPAPVTEGITLPFDATRTMPAQSTTLLTFAGSASQYVSINITPPPSGGLVPTTLRLLQGSTALATVPLVSGYGSILALLPAAGTYAIEIGEEAAIEATAGYHLQAQLLGGLQTEPISMPLDLTRTLPPYTVLHGMLDVSAPRTVYLAAHLNGGSAAALKLSAPDGSVLFAAPVNNVDVGATLTLAAPGSYVLEVAAQASTSAVRVTLEPTLWTQVAPQIDVAGLNRIVDLVADRSGQPVVGYTAPLVRNGQSSDVLSLRRWTGAAWETVAADLTIDRPCNGTVASFAFDSSNRPVVVYASAGAGGGTFVSARRFIAGAWVALGPNDGTLPVTSSGTGACDSVPHVAIGSDDAPWAAYGSDSNVVVQRFDGTQWQGLAAPASGDVFALQSGSYDIAIDAGGRAWLVTSSSQGSGAAARARRFNAATATWDGVGPNGGALAEIGTAGLDTPRLRFDAGGLPVIGWVAAVLGASGKSTSAGVAVYRYDGTAWSTTGGYQTGPNTFLQNGASNFGFTLFNGDALAAWSNDDILAGTVNAIIQRNTAAGWSAVGAGAGEIAQFAQRGVTNAIAGSSRPLGVGSELYLAVIEARQVGTPAGAIRLSLLHMVAQ